MRSKNADNAALLRSLKHALAEQPRPKQRDLALRLGISRARVSNLARVLDLPDGIQRRVFDGALSPTHGVALASAPPAHREGLAAEAIAKSWSVARLNQAIAKAQGKRVGGDRHADPDLATLENALGEHLGARVLLRSGVDGAGEMTIQYSDLDTLDGIFERLGFSPH